MGDHDPEVIIKVTLGNWWCTVAKGEFPVDTLPEGLHKLDLKGKWGLKQATVYLDVELREVEERRGVGPSDGSTPPSDGQDDTPSDLPTTPSDGQDDTPSDVPSDGQVGTSEGVVGQNRKRLGIFMLSIILIPIWILFTYNMYERNLFL